jgi:ribosome modulation factor
LLTDVVLAVGHTDRDGSDEPGLERKPQITAGHTGHECGREASDERQEWLAPWRGGANSCDSDL